MSSLQESHLPEAAEILDILNQLELEALFYSHDKLADIQVQVNLFSLPNCQPIIEVTAGRGRTMGLLF